MGKKKFKLILCDLGNVLINFDHRIAVRRILPFTNKRSEEIYSLFFDSPVTKDYEEGRLSSRDFYRRISKILSLKNLTFKKFSSIWNEIFFDNYGMLELLEALKKKYSLHLVSNINELHYRYIAKNFPRHISVFDRVFLSFEVGARKPAREIYRRAVEHAGFSFEDVLYTDDRADLIDEAKGMGIRAVLFKDVKDLKNKLKKIGV
ncbi:MAG: HAD family phosphatase [Candidatus Omnitrophica bacterium]|nr:HAD family phosphatase [Candidatus Omnitrophota bacterium]